MTTETTTADAEKPLEINNLSVEPQETVSNSEAQVSKKPSETRVFNHGTGKVTFVQALKLIDASRATLSRYTNDGKISFETDQSGHKIYQVVELERVFGKLKAPETQETVTEDEQSNHLKPQEPNAETALKLALLEQENRFLRETADRAQQEAEDWKQQATRALQMLTYQPKPEAKTTTLQEPEPQPAPQPKKKFLGIFGGR